MQSATIQSATHIPTTDVEKNNEKTDVHNMVVIQPEISSNIGLDDRDVKLLIDQDISTLSPAEKLQNKFKKIILKSPPNSFKEVLNDASCSETADNFFEVNYELINTMLTNCFEEHGFNSVINKSKDNSCMKYCCDYNGKTYKFMYNDTLTKKCETKKDAWLKICMDVVFDIHMAMLMNRYPAIMDKKTNTYVVGYSFFDNYIAVGVSFHDDDDDDDDDDDSECLAHLEKIELHKIYDPEKGFDIEELKKIPLAKFASDCIGADMIGNMLQSAEYKLFSTVIAEDNFGKF